MQTPQNIRVLQEEHIIEIVWNDDTISRLPMRPVRQSCPCAACVNEFPGEHILDP